MSSVVCRTAAGHTGAGAGEGLVATVQPPVRQALVAAGRRRRRLAAHRRLHRGGRLQQVDTCISRASHQAHAAPPAAGKSGNAIAAWGRCPVPQAVRRSKEPATVGLTA